MKTEKGTKQSKERNGCRALRASRNSWDSGSTMGSTLNPHLSSLTPPPYLSAQPSFCHLPSLGSALRASRNSWDSGSTMGSTLNPHLSSLTPPPYLSALPSFCHLLSLGSALRASRNSWDSGSTMRSTNNHLASPRLCERLEVPRS